MITSASDRGLPESSHRNALSAFLFLYGKALGLQSPWMQENGHPVPKRRLPVVLSVEEVLAVLARLQGEHQLMARLLYGTGLRITEALPADQGHPPRATRDLHAPGQWRQGSGGDAAPILDLLLRERVGRVRQVWAVDGESGLAGMELPHSLERRYPTGRCQLKMVLGLPSRPSFNRSAQWRHSTTPSLRRDLPAHVLARGSGSKHRQSSHAAHAAALFCDLYASSGEQHPHRAGVDWARRYGDHHDLNPCAKDGQQCRASSPGLAA